MDNKPKKTIKKTTKNKGDIQKENIKNKLTKKTNNKKTDIQEKPTIRFLVAYEQFILPHTFARVMLKEKGNKFSLNNELEYVLVVARNENKIGGIGVLCSIQAFNINHKTNKENIVLKGLKTVRITKIDDIFVDYHILSSDKKWEHEELIDIIEDGDSYQTQIETFFNISVSDSYVQNKIQYLQQSVLENDLDLRNKLLLKEFYEICMMVLTPEYKSVFIKLLTLEAKVKYFNNVINESNEIQRNKALKPVKEKVEKAINKSNREYYLREQLKVIKKELGMTDEENDFEDLLQRLDDNPYPPHIKKRLKKEINKLLNNKLHSNEVATTREYVDTVLDLPWFDKTQDNLDLKKALNILDDDHYGLDNVKQRIIEYLAIKQVSNSLKTPILCLAGPPGIGKTSLGESIARALSRKFAKISLGGIDDEAEIRGHRKTYLSSMPGRIIKGISKAGSLNPVILLDEIDKITTNSRGDPSAALLEVLDPEQNSKFSDNYIEEEFDLSNVIFITTANYLADIPEALKDRLEVIELSSYTEHEKFLIARNHLIPKYTSQFNIKSNKIVLNDDIIYYIIRHYTKESGVRELERKLNSIYNKAVLAIVKDKVKKVTITKKLLVEWLGLEIYDFNSKEKIDQVGVVTGLAYTKYGGDILAVEATCFDGKGIISSTGRLGEVMSESLELAYNYIKANRKKYNIPIDYFTTKDTHVHVPEGAIPKDGPSAGITIATSLISAITKTKVKADVAMTGEITLRGNVLPIGGLKEKCISASRSGIKTVVIPYGNKKDLHDIPDTVKNNMEFVFVKKIDDVLKIALDK